MGSATEAAHECAYPNVTVASVDGVARTLEWEPDEGIRVWVGDSNTSHRWLLPVFFMFHGDGSARE
jgi:hypothetical protein